MALIINRGVSLGDDILFLAISGEIVNVSSDAPLLYLPIRRFEESEIIHAGKSRQRCNQSDVGAFRSLHGTDPPVVRRVNVTHFETGPVARETAWPEGGESALMRELSQRVYLIHELRKLAASEEVADHRRKRFGIDKLLRGHAFHALIKKRHAL